MKMLHTEMSKQILGNCFPCRLILSQHPQKVVQVLGFLASCLHFLAGSFLFQIDEINASTLEDQATLNITPAANTTHWQSTASGYVFSSKTASSRGAAPPPVPAHSCITRSKMPALLFVKLSKSGSEDFSEFKEAHKREDRNKQALTAEGRNLSGFLRSSSQKVVFYRTTRHLWGHLIWRLLQNSPK